MAVCQAGRTGVSIAANKVPGIRFLALCTDPETTLVLRPPRTGPTSSLVLRFHEELLAREISKVWSSTPARRRPALRLLACVPICLKSKITRRFY
ncbi:MAG: RpiB/LacA/LacB family sugar-phosphate isomerase [Caldilineales bacterium]|nr:RpiB/LacA/LacB family sugar-phosphate isomerase [Caldilineales bacterium]